MMHFCLSFHIAYLSLEMHYRDTRRRIICEEYIEAEGGLPDYKFHCSNGKSALFLFAIKKVQKGTRMCLTETGRNWMLWKEQRLTKIQ